jgi:GLPGLI family protein
VQFNYDLLPPERQELRDRIPPQSFTSLVLLFNGSESLMQAVAPDAEARAEADTNARMAGYVTRLKMSSTARGDHETLLDAYVNYQDGTIAEAREFMGRDFLINGEQPTYAWRLTGEQSEFLGYAVQGATAEHEGANVKAWFTPQIPVSAGPGGFSGLPGMILVVSIDDEQTVYSATEVSLEAPADGAIRAPEDGSEVSRAEYEEIVAEKLEELRMLNPEDRAQLNPDVRRDRAPTDRAATDRPPGDA